MITRRQLLRSTALAPVALAGCSFFSGPPTTTGQIEQAGVRVEGLRDVGVVHAASLFP